MAYNQNIPEPTDKLSKSQGDIQRNFQSLYAAFTKNHELFNVPKEGEHTLITFVKQVLPVISPEETFLLFGSEVSGNSQLFYARDGGESKQVSETIPTTDGNGPGTPTSYTWDFFSGISLRFGDVTRTANVPLDVVFDTPFPNVVYIGLVSVASYTNVSSALAYVRNLTVEGFELRSRFSYAGRFYYLAIGR